MPVAIQIDHRNAALKSQDLLAFATSARAAAKLRGTVTILITSNERLQALNRTFRGKDKPTDVLSFPSPELQHSTHAGDIAISAEIAKENASLYGHSILEEVKVLILHGLLHLAGHDHECDNGQMARLESKLRAQLRLKESLIRRTQSSSEKPKPNRMKAKKSVRTAARRVSRASVAKARKRQTTK